MAAVLEQLLEEYPGAVVAAIGGQNAPTVVPPPKSLNLEGHPPLEVASLLDLVVAADRVVVSKLWGTARIQGAAVAPVRLAADPNRLRTMYFLDVRPEHGVMVALVMEEGWAPDHSAIGEIQLPSLPPRIARAGKDGGARWTWIDSGLAQILGWSPEEMIGHMSLEFIHPDDAELAIASWMESLDSPGPGRRVRLRHRHKDGSWVWLEITNHNHLDRGDHPEILAEMVDISDEMAAHNAVRAREQLLALLTETVPVGLFHADLQGNLLYANRRLHEIMGTQVGSTMAAQLANLSRADRTVLDQAVRRAQEGADVDVELGVDHPGGARHVALNMRPLRDETGAVTGLTGCMEDVTERVLSRLELEARAATDPLTGCLNREATLARLEDLLQSQRSGPGDEGVAVMFMDLDRLKPLNDSYGHAAGDELLVNVAARLRDGLRNGDMVGRFGGDEFVLVCRGVANPAAALELARGLSRRVFGRVELAAATVDLSASLGVAWSNGRNTTAATLVQEADVAMYQSKRAGRGEPVLAG